MSSRTGLCLGQCYHKKSSACRCKLGWSSQPLSSLRHHLRVHSSASEAVLTSQSDFTKLLVGNEKIGVLLLNLGGPETLDDVQPFLFNLFADPVIATLNCNCSALRFFNCSIFYYLFCRFTNYGAKTINGEKFVIPFLKCAIGYSSDLLILFEFEGLSCESKIFLGACVGF